LSDSKKKKAREFMEMIKAYYNDGVHFFEEKKFLESFECFVYTWGWLDAGARMDFFKIPKEVKRHFKIEQ
jgi:hypothetical protein